MSHRMYLYNKAVVGSSDDDSRLLMEWGYELPLLLQPLFSAAPCVGANCYNSPGSEEGLYAEAKAGIQALRDFYDFIERHAGSLLDDVEAFRTARQKIFQLLDQHARHAWFHLDAWDVFNMADTERRTQAEDLLGEIEQANACIREAIACDNPLLLDNCPGVDAPWAGSFRAVLNLGNYDYGWEPLGAQLAEDEDGLEIFCENERYGLRDASGQVLVEPRYQAFFDFDWSSGLACVQHDQRFGYVDRQGREVIACQFEDAFDFIGEHALIAEGGKFGLINRQGRVTVPCQFDGGEALDYTGAYWSVQQGELWGVIDPNGRWMLPAQYRQIHAYEGYYSAKPAQGAQHLFTTRFHDLGAIGLDNISSVSLVEGGEAYVIRRREGQQWRYRAVDERGIELLPGEFQSLQYLAGMQAWLVREKRLYGLYQHPRQAWLLPCQYSKLLPLDYASRDADGSPYCLVQDAKRWGLYRGGRQPGWAVEPGYQRLEHLQDALFNCCLEQRWGIVNTRGQLLREPLDQAPASSRFNRDGELALVFRDERAWVLLSDGGSQPLDPERALEIVDRYAQFGLSEVQQACLQGSAGDLWQALDSHRRGLIAYGAQDYATARPLLLRAVELGNSDAFNDLGCLLEHADQDYSGALACFQRACDAGSALAARNLGYCYLHGQGCAPDPAQARHYYQLASERGHRAAHLELARLLFEQEPPVGDQDLALQHYQAAWRFGERDESANHLGWLYEQREDYAQAQRYYQHSIGLGDGYAHWRMGRMHQYGLGCPSNPHKAREHLQIACEREQEAAYLDLAKLLLGEASSQEQALGWLRKAVESAVPGAHELVKELLQQQKKPGLFSRLFGRR